jgi:hypothetical protein
MHRALAAEAGARLIEKSSAHLVMVIPAIISIVQ